MTAPNSTETLLDTLYSDPAFAPIVGGQAYRYQQRWRSTATKTDSLIGILGATSWNWGAFFLTYFWHLYRGLFGRAVLYFLASTVFIVAASAGPIYGLLGLGGLLICSICAALTANAAVFGRTLNKFRMMGRQIEGLPPGVAPNNAAMSANLLIIDFAPFILALALALFSFQQLRAEYRIATASENVSASSDGQEGNSFFQQTEKRETRSVAETADASPEPTITASEFEKMTGGARINRIESSKTYDPPVNLSDVSDEAAEFAVSISGIWSTPANSGVRCYFAISMYRHYRNYIQTLCVDDQKIVIPRYISQIYNIDLDPSQQALTVYSVGNSPMTLTRKPEGNSFRLFTNFFGNTPTELGFEAAIPEADRMLLEYKIVQ